MVTRIVVPALHTVSPSRPAIYVGTRCRVVEVLGCDAGGGRYRVVTDDGIEFFASSADLAHYWIQGKLFE